MIRSFPSSTVMLLLLYTGRNDRVVTTRAGHVAGIHHAPLNGGVMLLLLLVVVMLMVLLLARLRIDRSAGAVSGARSRYKQNVPVSRLLQAVLVRRVGLPVLVAQTLKDVTIQLGKTVLDPCLFRREEITLLIETYLALTCALHLIRQREDLI